MKDFTERLDKAITNNLKFPESERLQQRGIADKIETYCNDIIAANFDFVRPATSRRSIEDINIGNVYVDHKTSDLALKFKMPNLISIDRLRKLDRPLVYNFVIYNSETKEIVKNFSLEVYELNWAHLKIQNLGKGQLQITNMAEFLKNPKTNLTREQWLDQLKQSAVQFYQKVQRDAERRIRDWA